MCGDTSVPSNRCEIPFISELAWLGLCCAEPDGSELEGNGEFVEYGESDELPCGFDNLLA